MIRQMLTGIDTQKAIADVAEFDQVLLIQCFQAKNALIRKNGFRPEQIVLGKSTRLPASLCSDENAAAHALASSDCLEGEAFRKSLERRSQARQAFIEMDNDEAMRRALLRRSNPTRGPLKPGMWMLYWIKKSNPNRLAAGKWYGPAKIISVEGSSIVYLSHGTKTIRAPPEYLRPASLQEWHQASSETVEFSRGTAPAGGSRHVIDLQGMPLPSKTTNTDCPNLFPTIHPGHLPLLDLVLLFLPCPPDLRVRTLISLMQS